MTGMEKTSEISECPVQLITVTKHASLGLSLGGLSSTEGPLIYVKDIIPGGDCHKDGRLRPGDRLVSVNAESLLGVSCEEAKSLLNRAKLRSGATWEIAFIRSDKTRPERISHSDQSSRSREAMDFAPTSSSTPSAVKSGLPVQRGQVKGRQSPDVSEAPVSALHPDRHREKLAFLNPDARIKVEKLESALNYLGISPTEEQKLAIRQSVQTDANGTVSFGDFVQVARNLFSLQLMAGDLGPNPVVSRENESSGLLSSVANQVQSCNLSDTDDVERLKREKDKAFAEIKRLKDQLFESEKQKNHFSEELENVKREAKASVEEARALRSRIHLAEVAQRQARAMEMDFEEVIRLLEAEIAELRAQLADHSGQNKDSAQDLKRRITVLGCQLRKSELARKTFEVSTEKLLQFVESVPELLADDTSSTLNLCERIPAFPSQLSRLGANRRGLAAALATEAKELARSVRSIIEADCLPYGWEEAYTADGIKYFINHVTQTTSWTHPVASALSLLAPEDAGEDHHREAPDLKSC
ncbi:syntaxin-binding protein 4 [Spea bombifrons]|uniref:syntaxin-binding protein 4 n=1 Tax=Spea bombifrons TaxID=233779 RepID=UPI00234B04FF|nr:syntaxin-binding protein 4 [Spea bombifrons]